MEIIKVSLKYRLWQFAGILLVYLVFLFAYSWVKGTVVGMPGIAVSWGICMAAIYITFVARLSIRLDGSTLVYKRTNGIWPERLPVDSIKSVETKRGMLVDKVVISDFEDNKVVLYPESPADFRTSLVAHGYPA